MKMLVAIKTNIFVTGDGVLIRPNFDSGWLNINSDTNITNTTKYVAHGLGETPLLVDVQVKAVDGPNQGYIFPAVGRLSYSTKQVKCTYFRLQFK